MKANCWCNKRKMRVLDVPDPKIVNPRDAIVKVTSTAICGSDLHLFNGFIPSMQSGDIVGHEFMGEVVEVGQGVETLEVGERVVVPFPIACGSCFFCKRELTSLCENTNPNAWMAEKMFGHSPSGIFGYSHMTGGYAGGQAQYVRVPFADVNPFKVGYDLPDEKVLFLTDIFPTAYMAAENCDIRPDDTVAVWGCGPVGQLTIACAKLLGAARVIAIDRFEYRLDMAKEKAGADVTINYEGADLMAALLELTGGLGPDKCIDAVGLEAHAAGLVGAYDRVKQATMGQSDRPHVVRQCIMACRKGGVVSIPGVYGGLDDKIPLGALMNKALTIKTGQTHVHRYLPKLLDLIRQGKIDPSFIITHRLSLSEAAHGFEIFNDKEEEVVKIVLKP